MASTSALQSTTLLPPLNVSHGTLSTKPANSESWEQLASPDAQGRYNFNCRYIRFDDGVTISQVDKQTEGVCSVKFTVEPPTITDTVLFTHEKAWIVEAKCITIGEPEFSSRAVDNSGVESARTLALATLDKTTDYLKLTLLQRNFNRKTLNEQQIREQITTLTARKGRGSPKTDAGVYLQELFAVSMAETDYQTEKAMKQTGCKVVIEANDQNSQLYLHVTPRANPDYKDVDILTGDLPLRFSVHDHPILTQDELPTHRINGRQESENWEISLVNYPSEAPIVGVIANSFLGQEDLRRFVGGVAHNVTLVPIIDDILGSRARKANRDLGMTSADLEGLKEGQVSEYLDPTKALSKLPLDSLFLVGKPVPSDEALALGGLSSSPVQWNQSLEDRQAEGVKKSIQHSVCAVHGPPGTGKSQVASRILWCLLKMSSSEKILCSAPANVALESLLQHCIKECKSLSMTDLPFVRIWSLSQTKAHYSNKEYEVLTQPYHIEALRLNIARSDGKKWADYLAGHKLLMEQGVINDEKIFDAWNEEAKTLTRLVMDNARVAFCTTAALSSPALKWRIRGGEPQTWPAGTWLLDEAAQANPDAVLLGLVTFASTLGRFTMFGDHYQLDAFKGSDRAKASKIYRTSFLESFCNRRFPSVLLNCQFRALESCMLPVNRVYGGAIFSAYSLKNPGPLAAALSHLQGILPLTVTVGPKHYDITKLHNFIDVAHGEQFVPEKGTSSGNLQEVEVVSGIVQALEEQGTASGRICIFSAYRKQLELLRTEATKAQWGDCFVNTIDKSQGQEFDIVIISLVKTEGHSGLIEEVGKACVACSRHKIACYLVGNWKFWDSPRQQRFRTLTNIKETMKREDVAGLVVRGENVTRASLSSAAHPSISIKDGKRKAVDFPEEDESRKKVEVENRPELEQRLKELEYRIKFLGDEEKRYRARREEAEEERRMILQQMGSN